LAENASGEGDIAELLVRWHTNCISLLCVLEYREEAAMRAALLLFGQRMVCCFALCLMQATWLPAQQQTLQQHAVEAGTTSFTSLEPLQSAWQRPAHLVVVRISADVLKEALPRHVDVTVPVRDVVFGTPVSGVARMAGEPRVELIPSSDQARFNVVFSGTVYSRTIGYGGPATIYGHSITSFTATKQVIFEPGKGFQSLPPQIAATTRCYTDNIATSRGGIIGRIVERRASEEVAARHAQLTALARDRAMRRVQAAFDRQLTTRIAELNQSVDVQVKLAEFRNREGSRRLMACTTPEYLQISDVIYQGNPQEIKLPDRRSVATSAPIQVWVHNSLVPATAAQELATAFKNPDQSAVVNGLALLPGILGKEAAAAITAFAAKQAVDVENIGDWFVIDVNAANRPDSSPIAQREAVSGGADRR
jgi:hypothetical protein